MNDDSRLLVMWSLSALLAVISVGVIGIVVPGLVNMHNDGALILAIALAIMLPVATFISARRLRRLCDQMGDNNK